MRITHTPMAWLMLTTAGLAAPAAAQDATYGYARAGYDTDGQSVDTIAVFFEPLSHYGRWLDGRYGREWSPNVPRDWRPYTIGHWEEGAYGQTWRSDEPFGWAVFHFGRWAFDPPVGWVWLPDTVWGPAWVAWRDGDDVTGWAPLPPQVNALSAGGDGFNDWGYDQWYQPGWVYVPRGYFYARSLRGVTLPYARSRDAWDRTRGTTRYDRLNGQVVNRSFGDARAERRDGRGERTMPRTPGSGDAGGYLNGQVVNRSFGDARAERRDGRGERTVPSGDAGGYIPLPRGYGDGFVPGVPPRGFDRRAGMPGTVTGRPPPPARAPFSPNSYDLSTGRPPPLARAVPLPAAPLPAAPRAVPSPRPPRSGNERPR